MACAFSLLKMGIICATADAIVQAFPYHRVHGASIQTIRAKRLTLRCKNTGHIVMRYGGLTIFGVLAYVVAHEAGHAIVARVLLGCQDVTMHFGDCIDSACSTLAALGPIHVHSLSVPSAYTTYGQCANGSHSGFQVVVTIAGPLVGGIVSYVCYSLFFHWWLKANTHGASHTAWAECWHYWRTPFETILKNDEACTRFEQRVAVGFCALGLLLNIDRGFYALFPSPTLSLPWNMNHGLSEGDGTSLWETLGASLPLMQRMQALACTLEWLACAAVLLSALRSIWAIDGKGELQFEGYHPNGKVAQPYLPRSVLSFVEAKSTLAALTPCNLDLVPRWTEQE